MKSSNNRRIDGKISDNNNKRWGKDELDGSLEK